MKKLIRASTWSISEDEVTTSWKSINAIFYRLVKDTELYLDKLLKNRGVDVYSFNNKLVTEIGYDDVIDRCIYVDTPDNLKSKLPINRDFKACYLIQCEIRWIYNESRSRDIGIHVTFKCFFEQCTFSIYQDMDVDSPRSVNGALDKLHDELFSKLDAAVNKLMTVLEEKKFNVEDGVVVPIESKPSKPSWRSIVRSLLDDAESGIDPIYEQTDEGMEIQYACGDVDRKKGVQCIPSTQLGQGIMEIYDSDDNLLTELDYQDYEQEVLSLVFRSKNKTDFKKKYSEYIDSLIQ